MVESITFISVVTTGLTALVKWLYIIIKKQAWEEVGQEKRDKVAKGINIVAGLFVTVVATTLGLMQANLPQIFSESIMNILDVIIKVGGGGLGIALSGLLYDKILKPMGIKAIDYWIRGVEK